MLFIFIRLFFLAILFIGVLYILSKLYTKPSHSSGALQNPVKRRRKTLKVVDTFESASPQSAAIAMMIAMAQQKGALTREEKEKIFEVIDEKFHLKGSSASELFKTSIVLVEKSDSLLHLFNCLCPVINANCSYLEKKQLYIMLHDIAMLPSKALLPPQENALKKLQEYLEIGVQFSDARL